MISLVDNKKMSPVIRGLLLFVITGLLLIFQESLSQIGTHVARLFSYRSFDPDGAFAFRAVHHIVQGVLALLLMGILHLLFGIDFRLGLGNRRTGLRLTVQICAVFTLYQIIMSVLAMALKANRPFPHPMTLRNVTGLLGFQLLLAGPSEELLYRALPIAILQLITRKQFSLFKGRFTITVSVIVSALLFTFAHIYWDVLPLRPVFSWPQMIYTFMLGCLQGYLYIKTGSVVYSMFIHSYTNVLVVASFVIMQLLG